MHLTPIPTPLHLPPARRSSASLAAVLLAVVYLAAIAVAVTAPGQRAVAGVVVLAGLTARIAVRRRRSLPAASTAVGTVTPLEAAPAAA